MKKSMKKSGFTLVEIMIVVAIIGLLAAIGIPSFRKARENTLKKTAINNARQVVSAIDQYALENALTDGASVAASDVNDYLKGGTAGLKIGNVTPTLTSLPTVGNDVEAKDLAEEMYTGFGW